MMFYDRKPKSHRMMMIGIGNPISHSKPPFSISYSLHGCFILESAGWGFGFR